MNVALLRRLRERGGAYLPADALADHVRDLEEFEAFGFQLERHPLLGVAYRGPAERLCPDQIEDALGTQRIGRRIAVWSRVTSTNDLAARAAHSPANEGLVVLAEEQTAGRGRRGRSWSAPPRTSILMSVLLFPPESLADPAWLTGLGAVAVAEVVSEWSGRDARIKWPNDVRVGGDKVAGILVERAAGSVIGIGLNANVEAEDFPDDLRSPATSLRLLMGGRVDRSELARDLIRRLDQWYERSRTAGPSALAAAWRTRSEHVGSDVRIETRSGSLSGRLEEIDLLGDLTLLAPGNVTLRLPTRSVVAITTTLVRS